MGLIADRREMKDIDQSSHGGDRDLRKRLMAGVWTIYDVSSGRQPSHTLPRDRGFGEIWIGAGRYTGTGDVDRSHTGWRTPARATAEQVNKCRQCHRQAETARPCALTHDVDSYRVISDESCIRLARDENLWSRSYEYANINVNFGVGDPSSTSRREWRDGSNESRVSLHEWTHRDDTRFRRLGFKSYR